jgi:GNAT superfamily N-acetyltransferase
LLSTKNYSEEYLDDIIVLFRQVFGHALTKKYWDWRFMKNPFGKPITKLCFDDDRLVALYLLHPIKLDLKNKEENSLFSMFTMTDPDYFGMGIMTRLANEVFDFVRKQGYSRVIGFANENSRYMFTQKLGFKEITIMNELIMNMPVKISSKLKCDRINSFDDEFSEFYEKMRPTHNHIMIPRKKEYLNWRFFQNPENTYECYKITHNNSLAGYFVLKNYLGKKGHIIDFLTLNEHEVFDTVLMQSIDFCQKNHLTTLTLWTNPTIPIYNHLIQNGFYEEPMNTFFIQKNLTDRLTLSEKFTDWYITMSDSDVF